MNRRTRDLLTSGTNQDELTAGNACWSTPPAVFAKLDKDYHFDIDLFADAERALCTVWFGPGGPYFEDFEDSLEVPWHEYGECGYWNPPYGRYLRRVIDKVIKEAKLGFRSVGLIPMRWTKPLRKLVFHSGVCSAVLVPDKRLTFYENGSPRLDKHGKPMPALFDSVILECGPNAGSGPVFREWKVPRH